MTDLHQNLRHALTENGVGVVSPLSRLLAARHLKPAIMVGGIGFLVVLSYVDFITGPTVHFSLLYAAPVVAATWFVSRRGGYLMTVFFVVIRLVTEMLDDAAYRRPGVALWNAGVRAACLFAAVYWLSALKELRSRLEAMVQERTLAVRQLAAQLSQAEDMERRRLAHDIHDGFSQTLSVLKLNLAAALPESPPGGSSNERIKEAINTVTELIQQSRTLTFDLHPAMLDHFGVGATLQRFAEQFSRQTNIELTINEEGQSGALADAVPNYLFRAVKELVNNAARHGDAKQIVVSLYWIPSCLRVVIDDDGSGFDPAQVFSPQAKKGLGLAGINERMRSFGGGFRLESSAGSGTRVVMEFPLAAGETVEQKTR